MSARKHNPAQLHTALSPQCVQQKPTELSRVRSSDFGEESQMCQGGILSIWRTYAEGNNFSTAAKISWQVANLLPYQNTVWFFHSLLNSWIFSLLPAAEQLYRPSFNCCRQLIKLLMYLCFKESVNIFTVITHGIQDGTKGMPSPNSYETCCAPSQHPLTSSG